MDRLVHAIFAFSASAAPVACPNDCSLRGHCDASGACNCYPGWTGDACETPLACPSDCHGAGEHWGNHLGSVEPSTPHCPF